MFKEGEWIIGTKPLTFNGQEIDRSYMSIPLKVKGVTESHYLLTYYTAGLTLNTIMPFCDVENRGMIIANEALIPKEHKEA